VQRVIGLPGDTIWSVGSKIYIDGRRLHERGWYDSKYGQVGSTPILRTRVPPGEYFVMGDNRSDSCDSRAFGTIARSSIVGKVFAVVARDGRPYIHLF
jgi:signal peptidase I